MNRASFTLAVLIALGGSGCYATTIRSGLKPELKPSIENDERWHHGVVLGIAELSGPYDLSKICPNGWAEIATETSFLNGLVDALTSGLYNPQTISVRCASAPAPALAPAPQEAAASEAGGKP
jgi:hypothetical protein